MGFQLYNDDCLKVMPTIPDGSIDMILTDLPYGVTNKASEAGKWDTPIPMDPMWDQFWRVLKPNGACVLFAQGMFTAQLMMSQQRNWRYNLVWDKCRASGFLNSKRMPLRRHEDICVFYRSLPTYNVQLEDLDGREPTHPQGNGEHKDTNRCYGKIARKFRHPEEGAEEINRCYGSVKRFTTYGVEGKKYPGSILKFQRPHCSGNHPTEKSVDLCRWLIRTYTNPGETVLDATMGSGTTIVAACLENRNAIGIELEPKYYEVAVKRTSGFTNAYIEPIIEEEDQQETTDHDSE